jgi:hypothetical protein
MRIVNDIIPALQRLAMLACISHVAAFRGFAVAHGHVWVLTADDFVDTRNIPKTNSVYCTENIVDFFQFIVKGIHHCILLAFPARPFPAVKVQAVFHNECVGQFKNLKGGFTAGILRAACEIAILAQTHHIMPFTAIALNILTHVHLVWVTISNQLQFDIPVAQDIEGVGHSSPVKNPYFTNEWQ